MFFGYFPRSLCLKLLCENDEGTEVDAILGSLVATVCMVAPHSWHPQQLHLKVAPSEIWPLLMDSPSPYQEMFKPHLRGSDGHPGRVFCLLLTLPLAGGGPGVNSPQEQAGSTAPNLPPWEGKEPHFLAGPTARTVRQITSLYDY